MSLKKRKTPLTELWPEREALRVKPISNNNNFKINQKNENNSTQNRKQN